MSEVKAISFGFENCETAYIPINYVYTFNIGEVTKSKSYYPHGQGVREYTVGNKLYVQFNKSFYDFTDKTTFDDLVIERLKKWNSGMTFAGLRFTTKMIVKKIIKSLGNTRKTMTLILTKVKGSKIQIWV